jgi:transmembrane protein EpsG
MIHEYSLYPALSILFVFAYPHFYLDSCGYVRQWAAAAIAFFALRYILTGELKKYVFAILIAGLFHKSVLICLLILLVRNTRISTKAMLILAFISAMGGEGIGLFLSQFNGLPFVWYLQNMYGGGEVGRFIGLMNFLLLVIASIIRSRKQEDSPAFELFYTLSCIGMCISLGGRAFGHLAFRGQLYFMLPIILILPEIMDIVKRKTLFYFLFILATSGLLFLTVYNTRNEDRGQLFPYKTIFEAPKL